MVRVHPSPPQPPRAAVRAGEQLNSRPVERPRHGASDTTVSGRITGRLRSIAHLFNCSGVAEMAFMFEKLNVYQKAVDLADRVAGVTEEFPRGY